MLIINPSKDLLGLPFNMILENNKTEPNLLFYLSNSWTDIKKWEKDGVSKIIYGTFRDTNDLLNKEKSAISDVISNVDVLFIGGHGLRSSDKENLLQIGPSMKSIQSIITAEDSKDLTVLSLCDLSDYGLSNLFSAVTSKTIDGGGHVVSTIGIPNSADTFDFNLFFAHQISSEIILSIPITKLEEDSIKIYHAGANYVSIMFIQLCKARDVKFNK